MIRYVAERLCGEHYRQQPAIYKKDGGKGYKDYRKLKSLKQKACMLCRSTRFLDMHHKDGDKKNSDPANIITVCRSCHNKIQPRRVRELCLSCGARDERPQVRMRVRVREGEPRGVL